MLNILCVCHNGMGTSMLLKINATNICAENGINASVEACAHGEALGFLVNTDIVLTSPELVGFLPETDAIILQTTNLLDKAVVTELLVNCVKENFPDEIS